jgi:tRNA/rRNA methyltransferase
MLNIVLVEPKGEENIGAVSRAMMNMGTEDLYLVNPAKDHLSEKSMNYAVHSKSILEKASIFPDLKAVLKVADLSIAITRRTGNYRRQDMMISELPDFLSEYDNKKVFLVFGREANGLTNEEILECDLVCSIPSSDKFPSINLSHAVMIVLYELFKKENNPIPEKVNIARRKDFDEMINEIYSALDETGFFKNPQPEIIKNYIKKILLRAKLKKFDTKIIKNIFKSISGIVKKFKSLK